MDSISVYLDSMSAYLKNCVSCVSLLYTSLTMEDCKTGIDSVQNKELLEEIELLNQELVKTRKELLESSSRVKALESRLNIKDACLDEYVKIGRF